MTPVFFAFTDRQKIYDPVEAITGFRMHPALVPYRRRRARLAARLGSPAARVPEWMPKRLDSYEKAALRNTILKGRSQGVAAYGAKEALEWGTTGAGCARPGSTSTYVNGVHTLATKTLTLKCRWVAAFPTAIPA